MKLLSFLLSLFILAGPVMAQEEQQNLNKDQQDACAALLCLATSQRPAECSPPVQRYFSIRRKKLSDTLDARRAFLNLCPSASQDGRMKQLVDDITNGAGFCDAASLNARLKMRVAVGDKENRTWVTYISNAMPPGCKAYYEDAYVSFNLPRYVGNPMRGGYWVESEEYDQALKAYLARIAAEDEAAKKKKQQPQRSDR